MIPRQPLKSWQRTLYILFVAQLMTAVGFSSIFPFLPLYVGSLETTTRLSVELLSGLVFSAQAFSMMIASPIWGAVADRFGRKLMVQRATFGGAGIILLMAFVQSAEQLVVLRTIQGLITGMVAAASALVAAETPRSHTGYAMGLLQVGIGSGVALGPLLGGAVADYFGYQAAFVVTATLLLASGILVNLGIQEDFYPAQTHHPGFKEVLSEWRQILTSTGAGAAFTLSFLHQLGRMMVIPLIPLLILNLLSQSAGVNSAAGLVIGAASATATISALLLGRLGDRVGHRSILIASLFAAGLAYIPQAIVATVGELILFQALVGISMGGILPSVSALLAMYSHDGVEGSVYGLNNSVRAGARFIAPLLGAGVAAGFGLRFAFLATAVVYVLSGILSIVALPKAGSPTDHVSMTLNDQIAEGDH